MEQPAQDIVHPLLSEGDRARAIDGMRAGIAELQHILLEDGTGTVHAILAQLRTTIDSVVKRVLDHIDEAAKRQSVETIVELSRRALRVFGPEVMIFTLLNNVCDNVLRRAFEEGTRAGSRCLRVRSEAESPAGVRVVVEDNGRGITPSIKYGVGLTTVDAIARRMCRGWNIEASTSVGYTTQVWFNFFGIEMERDDGN